MYRQRHFPWRCAVCFWLAFCCFSISGICTAGWNGKKLLIPSGVSAVFRRSCCCGCACLILAEHAVVPRLAGTVRIAAWCSVLHRLLVCGTERPRTYCHLSSDVWNRSTDRGGMHSVLRRCTANRGLVSVPAPVGWIRQKVKFPFAMQFSYGLFLLASWIPLLSVLNGSFWQNFVMLYSFFSLCNCVTIVLCRRLENGRALSGITQIVNLLAIFQYCLCSCRLYWKSFSCRGNFCSHWHWL